MITMPRSVLALVVGVGLTLGACTGSDPSPSEAQRSSSSEETTAPSPEDTTTTATTTAPTPEWASLDRALSGLAPEVSFLSARVSPDGTCDPVDEVEPSTPRPTASQFKLLVLDALADQIAAGQVG